MARLLLLLVCFIVACNAGETRVHYIAADEVIWDYAPSGINLVNGNPLLEDENAAVFFEEGPDRIGGKYLKAIFREYKDSSFNELMDDDDEMRHKGILGPIIWAEVGDTIKVVFKNNGRFDFSVHPHGVFYSKESEGAKYPDGTFPAGDSVAPGDTYTYTWPVPARAGPGPGDWSSMVWTYHSHVEETKGTNSGLVGAIVITAKGFAHPNGHPKDVDREAFLFYTVFDENNSPYLDANLEMFVTGDHEELLEDGDFEESNLMHALNGYLYNNMPEVTFNLGERVRWYVLAMGTEVDLHSAHWHGNSLLKNRDHRLSSDIIVPGTTVTLDMVPDVVGKWQVECHVNDHLGAGMLATYTVVGDMQQRDYASMSDPFAFLWDSEPNVVYVYESVSSASAVVINGFMFILIITFFI